MHLFIRNQLNLVPCTVNSLTSPRYSYIQRRVVGSWYGDLGRRRQFQLIQFLALLSQHKPVVLLRDAYHCLGLNATSHHYVTNIKAIVDIKLRPHCALPSPPSRPIGCIACAPNFWRFLFVHAWHTKWSLLVWCYWWLNDPFCSERCSDGYSKDCQSFWIALTTPKIAPSPWDFITLPEEDHATAIGNMQRKYGKDRAWFQRYVRGQTNTHTQTDVHITILCHCSLGQSNKAWRQYKSQSDSAHRDSTHNGFTAFACESKLANCPLDPKGWLMKTEWPDGFPDETHRNQSTMTKNKT